MDEKLRKLAGQYADQNIDRVISVKRFPVALRDRETTTVRLYGYYTATVRSRGCEMRNDECTEGKIDSVVRWMHDSGKRGLLLCGTLGNGKTTMMKALKLFFGSAAVMTEAQAIYDYYRKNEGLPPFSPSDVLLIDDLGVEPQSFNHFGDIRYPITELLISRYRTNSTTIISTNLTFSQIGEIYGDRVKDRMKEMFAQIVYSEPSYR